jgi:hypothetical protein
MGKRRRTLSAVIDVLLLPYTIPVCLYYCLKKKAPVEAGAYVLLGDGNYIYRTGEQGGPGSAG